MSEEQVLDSELDTETNEETVEETTEQSEKVTKDWQAEAAKWKAIAERNKKKAQQAPQKADEAKIINNESVSDAEERLERLELKLEGYEKDVIEEIMANGGKAFLQTTLGKKVADEMNEQLKAEKAADIKSSSKSEFESKYSKNDLAEMSSEELAKILPKAD